MRRPLWRSLALAAPLALVACGSLMMRDRPAPADHIKFSHKIHPPSDLECEVCHDGITTAKDITPPHLPKEEVCLACHQDEKDSNNCTFCHTDAKHAKPFERPEPELIISHAAHLPRVKDKGDCMACHKELPEPGRPLEASRPSMDACLSCHEHSVNFSDATCSRCHTDLRRYPLQPVSLISHEGDFFARHGGVARAKGATCVQCHDESFCVGCHARTVSQPIERVLPEDVTRRFIHRNDWLGRHPLEAKADPATCKRCHGQSFCDNCHTVQNITPLATDPRNPQRGRASSPSRRRSRTSRSASRRTGPARSCGPRRSSPPRSPRARRPWRCDSAAPATARRAGISATARPATSPTPSTSSRSPGSTP